MRRIEDDVVDFVPGIKDAREDFLFVEPQIDSEIVAVAGDDFRGDDLRAVVLRVMIIVLDESESLRERGARDEDDSNPMMNQAARYGDRFAIVESGQLLDYNLAGTELSKSGDTLGSGKGVYPKERSGVSFRETEGGIDSGFGESDIAVEGGGRLLLEVSGRCRPDRSESEQEKEHGETQGAIVVRGRQLSAKCGGWMGQDHRK
ncbi:MAG TPA: hypothetical protein VJN21_05490 [Candidatus Acidoferrales bacterium]|nr:hypothetical protein [Candidatus Acidoferrales bacterium]